MAPTTTDSRPKDARFAAKVKRNKNLCTFGILILVVLSLASFVVSVVSYVRNRADRPEELAHCVVFGLFFPVLVYAAYLAFTIKPNKASIQKFIFGATTTILFTLCSIAFAILIGRHVVGETAGGSEPKLKGGIMIVDLINFVFGFMIFFISKPLFKALRWCNRSPETNGPALAYASENWELPRRVNVERPSGR